MLTAEDLAEVEPLLATSRMKGYYATPILPLARHKVRHVGEPIVGVMAESRYLAEDAAELVEIEFEPLAAVTIRSRPRAGAPLLHEEAGTNVLVAREFKRGDVDAAFAQAPVTVGGRFRMRRQTALAIEPRRCVAEYEPGRDALTLHSATQVPGIIRDALADALDLPGHRLRVVAPDVGGGFGGKGSLYPEEIFVCAAARQLARAGEMGQRPHGGFRRHQPGVRRDRRCGARARPRRQTARAARRRDRRRRRLLDLSVDRRARAGAGGELPARALSGRALSRPRQAVATCKPPTGPYRGVGRPVSTFVMERLIDMAAARLGIDPKEIRLRNLVRPRSFRTRSAPASCGTSRASSKAERRVRHDRLRRRCASKQAEARAAGKWFGIGIACYAELTGIGSRISVAPGMPINTGTETATIRIDSTGAITAAFGIASHGQGLETTLAQVIAEHLGARIEDMRVMQGDSAAVPGGTGTYASRSTVLAGGAARLASETLREKVVNVASHLLEAAPADLVAERRAHHGRGHGSLGVVPRGGARGLFRHGAAAAGGARGARGDQDLRSGVRHHHVGDAYRGAGDRSGDVSSAAWIASSSRRIAAASSIR